MKLFYCCVLILLVSCNTIKKEYVCGDRPCVDKKEFNEYFSKNLSVEIKTPDKKKNKSIDLVKLNTRSVSIKNDTTISKKDKKLRIKKEKEKLKAEKIRLQEERKNKKAQEQLLAKKALIKAKEDKKNAKIFKIEQGNNKEKDNKIDKKDQVKNILEKPSVVKKNKKEEKNKVFRTDTTKAENIDNICVDIKDCDINKIVEILSKKGKEKPFPNITSN